MLFDGFTFRFHWPLYLSRTEDRDLPINDKVVPLSRRQWLRGRHIPACLACLKEIKQPTLIVSGNQDVIVYSINALPLAQNMPDAKLILYPDANHGSWYQYHDDFVFETKRANLWRHEHCSYRSRHADIPRADQD